MAGAGTGFTGATGASWAGAAGAAGGAGMGSTGIVGVGDGTTGSAWAETEGTTSERPSVSATAPSQFLATTPTIPDRVWATRFTCNHLLIIVGLFQGVAVVRHI